MFDMHEKVCQNKKKSSLNYIDVFSGIFYLSILYRDQFVTILHTHSIHIHTHITTYIHIHTHISTYILFVYTHHYLPCTHSTGRRTLPPGARMRRTCWCPLWTGIPGTPVRSPRTVWLCPPVTQKQQ